MKRRSRWYAALLAALVTLTLAGCGYFAPRDPEEPGDAPPRHSPTEPESVLYNFEVALEYKVVGAPQLSESLDPDFLMELDVFDSNRLSGLMEIFKPEFERANRDFLSLRVQGNDIDFKFRTDVVPVDKISADLAFCDNLPYELLIYPHGGSITDTVEFIVGEVDLTLRSVTNWAILTWTDYDKPGDGVRHETYGYYMGFYSGLAAPGDILK